MNTAAFIQAVIAVLQKVFTLFGLFQFNRIYRRFFEKNEKAFFILNLEGEFLKANDSFLTEAGLSRERILGTKFLFFVHPQEQVMALDVIELLREGASVKEHTMRYRCANGEYKTMHLTAMGNGEIHAVARFSNTKSLTNGTD